MSATSGRFKRFVLYINSPDQGENVSLTVAYLEYVYTATEKAPMF